MPVRHKSGSRPYRDELRASLQALGAREPRLTELVARDLQQHGVRPRRAWRDAAELSQQQAADRFNQLTGNPGPGRGRSPAAATPRHARGPRGRGRRRIG